VNRPKPPGRPDPDDQHACREWDKYLNERTEAELYDPNEARRNDAERRRRADDAEDPRSRGARGN